MTSLLILRLDSPLQSWGLRSRWDFRDTGSMPSKSGIIGLLACALGLPRESKRIFEIDSGLAMGTRRDRSGSIMRDFQTVTGERGYLFNSQMVKRVGEPTIITPRQYIQDACFTIVLQGEFSLLDECAAALMDPVWQIYLGRKSCIPTRPVFESITSDYPSMEDALRRYPLCNRIDSSGRFYCEIEDVHGDIVYPDIIRISGVRYTSRRVRWFYTLYGEES